MNTPDHFCSEHLDKNAALLKPSSDTEGSAFTI